MPARGRDALEFAQKQGRRALSSPRRRGDGAGGGRERPRWVDPAGILRGEDGLCVGVRRDAPGARGRRLSAPSRRRRRAAFAGTGDATTGHGGVVVEGLVVVSNKVAHPDVRQRVNLRAT